MVTFFMILQTVNGTQLNRLNPVTDSLPHFTHFHIFSRYFTVFHASVAIFVDFVKVSGDMAWHCERQAKVLMPMQPDAMGK